MRQSALTLTVLLFVVNIFTVSNSKELENSLEMNDEEPKPGTGNSDSTSFVYSQSYDFVFCFFLNTNLFSVEFSPGKSKPETVVTSPPGKHKTAHV